MSTFLTHRKAQQIVIVDWCERCFGTEQSTSLPQRGLRLLEEAAEAAQAAGVTQGEAQRVIDHVFSRPIGRLFQEMGGVGVTALALCDAAGFYAEDAENAEIARVLAKPIEHFVQRNQEKNASGLKAGL